VREPGTRGMHVFESVRTSSRARTAVHGRRPRGGVLRDGVGTPGGDGVRARRRGFAGGEFGRFRGGGRARVRVHSENRERGARSSARAVRGRAREGGRRRRRLSKSRDFRRAKLVREDFTPTTTARLIVHRVLSQWCFSRTCVRKRNHTRYVLSVRLAFHDAASD